MCGLLYGRREQMARPLSATETGAPRDSGPKGMSNPLAASSNSGHIEHLERAKWDRRAKSAHAYALASTSAGQLCREGSLVVPGGNTVVAWKVTP